MAERSKYDGDAFISDQGEKFRVGIEGPNVRAEVYISRDRAAELRDMLNHALRHWPQPDLEADRERAR